MSTSPDPPTDLILTKESIVLLEPISMIDPLTEASISANLEILADGEIFNKRNLF